MHFQDRVVLVTGAAGGIGRALCFRMGRQGARLALLDRNGPLLQQLQDDLKAAGVSSATAVADVREREQVRAAVDVLKSAAGPADILVTAAGLCGFALVDDLKIPLLEEILRVNFLGTVYAIEAVLPEMLRRGSGQVVGIASLAAVRAIPFEGAYCASKAALASYLESLRPPLRRRGVKVTTIFPGFVRTPLLTNLLTETGSSAPPAVLEPEAAAERIARAIHRGSRVCCFPWTTSRLIHLSRFLPPAVYDWVMRRVAARVPLPY